GDASRFIGQRTAKRVMSIQIAKHPSAAVKEQQHRKRPFALGRINPDANLACRSRYGAVFALGDLRRSAVESFEQRAERGPRLAWSQAAERRRAGGCGLIDESLDLRV